MGISTAKELRLKKLPKLLSPEYAAFRESVMRLLWELVPHKPSVVVDPMAGTAPLLPYLQLSGHSSYMFDPDPVHFHINKIRTFEAYQSYRRVGHAGLLERLKDCTPELDRASQREVVTDRWLDDATLAALELAWQRTASFRGNVGLLLRGLLLLSVRPLSAYARTTNPTWIKPGGLRAKKPLAEVIQKKLDLLGKYYQEAYSSQRHDGIGEVFIGQEDARFFQVMRKAHLIFTSPPYCNRLDYQRLYGPEHYFLLRMGHVCRFDTFIGTNVVKQYETFEGDFKFVCERSELVRKFLEDVKSRQIQNERTSHYYAKYFTRYFSSLFEACRNMLSNLRKDGKLAIVVQNNAHRGLLIDLGKILEEFLTGEECEVHFLREWERNHQGLQHVSRKHRLVSPKQLERILVATR